MARTALTYLARPNVASLGYALFLAINAAGVWGGVFPFLPLDFQTSEIIFWFFLTQSLVFSLCYFASAVGVYFLPGPTRRFLVRLACIPYLLGWCCLIAAIYFDRASLPLVIVGGAFLGLGSAGFYMLWQRLFASSDSDRRNLDLIRGTVYGAIMYFGLYAIPQAVTAFLIPLVFMPLFGLAIVLKSREIDLDQPMFEDVPYENAAVYRAVIRDYWRSALCVGAIGFCTGIMRALAIGEPQVGSLVNMLSMAASFVGAITMLALWKVKSVRFNVVGLYRVAFPFVITSFLLLPFSSLEYARWQAAILYAVYSVVIMLMMIQCAQASRDRGINPVFIYGFFGGIVYTLHDVGFLAGTFSEQVRIWGIDPLATTALVSLYLLGFMFFIGQGGFKRVLRHDPSAENIELIMLDGHPPARAARSAFSQLPADDEREDRAAGAPEGDFPAEPPTAFPEKPATVAESTHSEGEIGRHDSGQPDGERTRRRKSWRQPRFASGRPARARQAQFRKRLRADRPPLQASAGPSRAIPLERTRDGGHGIYRARVHRRAHRRGAHRVGEHHPHAQQAHLREARRAQKARAHRHAQGRRAVGPRIPQGERFPAASLSHRPIGRARSARPHTSRAHRRAP